MTTNSGRFQPGKSGNPNGRPPKSRALTDILEKRGNSTCLDVDGKRRSGKNIVARAVWELAATGHTTLQDGDGVREIEVGARGWFEIVKWLYSQIDGPPKAEFDVLSDGKPLQITLRPVSATMEDSD